LDFRLNAIFQYI